MPDEAGDTPDVECFGEAQPDICTGEGDLEQEGESAMTETRTKFEQHAAERYLDTNWCDEDGGYYTEAKTGEAWLSWQAALASSDGERAADSQWSSKWAKQIVFWAKNVDLNDAAVQTELSWVLDRAQKELGRVE